MATLTLYGPPQSSYVRTARMVCFEKGLAHDLAPVELASDTYRRIHPWSRVPALRDGDFELYETSAIARYLEDIAPVPRLIPTSAIERGRMEQWISAINSYVYDHVVRKYALAGYIIPKQRGVTRDQAAFEENLPHLRRDLELLDEGYSRSTFLAGNEISLADLFVAPIVATAGLFSEAQEVLSRSRHLGRAFAALRERPSFASAHAGLG